MSVWSIGITRAFRPQDFAWPIFLALFSRVTIDGLSERGTTRSLQLNTLNISTQSIATLFARNMLHRRLNLVTPSHILQYIATRCIPIQVQHHGYFAPEVAICRITMLRALAHGRASTGKINDVIIAESCNSTRTECGQGAMPNCDYPWFCSQLAERKLNTATL